MKILKRLVARFKRPPFADVDTQPQPAAPSTALIAILAARALIYEQLDQSSQNGVVVDALPRSLYANHLIELAEMRRQFAGAEQRYQACLRQVDAIWPKPPPPAPKAPIPAAPKFFPRMGKMLRRRSDTSGVRH